VERRLLDGFARMLAFDALIGANDRHAQNWGVIESAIIARQPHDSHRSSIPLVDCSGTTATRSSWAGRPTADNGSSLTLTDRGRSSALMRREAPPTTSIWSNTSFHETHPVESPSYTWCVLSRATGLLDCCTWSSGGASV
jgi:hypothetical protein